MYGSVKQTMEVVITSALTFLVATTVRAKLATAQMEPLAEVSYMLSVPKFSGIIILGSSQSPGKTKNYPRSIHFRVVHLDSEWIT